MAIWRFYRQTLILIQKNLLVAWKKPVSTLLRTWVVPIALTLILCFLKYVSPSSLDLGPTGFSNSSSPVLDLPSAIIKTETPRLVFVTNGLKDPDLDHIIQEIVSASGMEQIDTRVLNQTDELFNVCPQSIQGAGHCYAAVTFNLFNETNVEYSIALSEDVTISYPASYDNQESLLSQYMLPLQWEINSRIGNLTNTKRPSERLWNGELGDDPSFAASYYKAAKQVLWLGIVQIFVAPVFICIFLGAAYHISTVVASEREVSGLMAAQRITATARISSTLLSFIILYLPSSIVCSIIFSWVLFPHTSAGLFFIFTVLCSISVIIFSHFIASFFQKASIAGMTSSILVFALALITLATNLEYYPNLWQIRGIALVFPPATWATLISQTATEEISQVLPADQQSNNIPSDAVTTPLFFIFLVFQIIVYTLATFVVERVRWSVKRVYSTLSPSETTALRVTNLSKTYRQRRKWYFPFHQALAATPAVDKVSLDVAEGVITFLLGPNGGGKTSFLKCISGMVSVDHGSHIALKPENAVFGICPQNNIFWGPLTVKEHVQIWRKLRNAASGEISNDDEEVISECDLTEKSQAAAKTLSGGQKRKLQLAMAFAGGSKMVCIDEATSGLDPLSRRNIWDIIQKGKERRTTLVTSHFLDEADILADHIVILYQGRVVCQGPSTGLKEQYGNGYRVVSTDKLDPNAAPATWEMKTSAEATRKVIDLELNNKVCDVVYPTLEQVFLRVTSSSQQARRFGGDGMIVDEEPQSTTKDPSSPENIEEGEVFNSSDLNLDATSSVGMLRQIWVLFRKRYMLLRSGWFVYLVNLAIPIVVAAVLFKYLQTWDTLRTCDMQRNILYGGPPVGDAQNLQSLGGKNIAALGPNNSFSGSLQDQLLENSVSAFLSEYDIQLAQTPAQMLVEGVVKVEDEEELVQAIIDAHGFFGFGLWSPVPENNIFFHVANQYATGIGMQGFDYMTNRMSNMTATTGVTRQVSSTVQIFNHVSIEHDWRTLPLQILILLAVVAAVSTAVIYPTYERKSHVRALQYSNGVSPTALWTAYLLFDVQFILVEALIVWGLLFSGSNGDRISYAPNYLLGAFVLFGIASYLGTYLVSMIFSRGTFAIAGGVHVALSLIYLAAYVMNQYLGPDYTRQDVYTSLQNGLGLTSPGANLARALWLSMNTFDTLCGKFGIDDVSFPMAYSRYGGVYCNLVIQVLFLAACIGLYEYGGVGRLRRSATSWIPGVGRNAHKDTRDNMVNEDDEIPLRTFVDKSRASARIPTAIRDDTMLQISHVTKRFGKATASQDISFDIAANETMALLGGNGAGKTTLFNMIRGELKPDHGSIHVNGVSVVDQARKARMYIGVCPQDDAVDNLTVEQTLTFYASVKGLKDVQRNVTQVLEALNIVRFKNHAHKTLSGGTKRKLAVAIALLGNPRLLLLDEPSTGQDAGAKRTLWEALRRVSKDRAILLTTHSMEEAEALASRVTIVSTSMLAAGSLASLQQTYGGLYKIRALKMDGAGKHVTENEVRTVLGRWNIEVVNYGDTHGLIQFNTVFDRTTLGKMMLAMECLVGNHDIIDLVSEGNGSLQSYKTVLTTYIITGPTMEEVFMNVVTGARRRVRTMST